MRLTPLLGFCALALGCSQSGTTGTGDSSSVEDMAGAVNPGDDLAGSTTPADLSQSTTPADMATSGAQHIKTVFLIVLENHSWSEFKGSASAPYLNKTLLPAGAHAEKYYGPLSGNLHPSEPNYIWLEAGDNLGILNDNAPSSNHQSTTSHLVTQLEAASVEWRSYQEDIADGTCPLTSVAKYAPKHNPMVFFDDVMNNAARCTAHVKALGDLTADLTNNSVGRYNFITPNLCNDGHDSCAPQNDPVKQSDDWLAKWVPQVLASQAYKDGGALFITWDESEVGSAACFVGNCPIGMVVLSPLGKTNYSNSITYDHSSMLKSVQEIFHVTPLLRGASSATDLADLFKSFP